MKTGRAGHRRRSGGRDARGTRAGETPAVQRQVRRTEQLPVQRRRAVEVARELRLRRDADPLLNAYRGLTLKQRAFVHATAREKLAEGGNRSGKTWTGIIDLLLEALGVHPTIQFQARPGLTEWVGWYATCSYELFALQGWRTFKRLVLFDGESELTLPTRRVLSIGWLRKNPQTPNYMTLRRHDGGIAHVYFKSYDQGAGAFQSGAAHRVHLDEECQQDIFDESQMRVLDTAGRLSISETPIIGEPWLDQLRGDAETGKSSVFHVRFPTNENPGLSPEAVAAICEKWRDHPEILDLRLRGMPLALEGAVYKDTVFTPKHVCDSFNVPSEWTRDRCIDYGFYNTACLWFAISPKGRKVLYREYFGREKTIAENARIIKEMSGAERYRATWIDPATLGPDTSTGERVIDLMCVAGVNCRPAVKGTVMAGVEKVWELLRLGPDGVPAFQVFRQCTEFLRERRGYRFKDAREKGDMGDQNPVKRDDHCMDAWRYWVMMDPVWSPPPPQAPPKEGTLAHAFWKKTAGRED